MATERTPFSQEEKESIRNAADNFFDSFQIESDTDQLTNFIELINGGYVPIIISNHQSLVDGVPISMVVEKIMAGVNPEKLNGFHLPYAVSVDTGDQSLFAEECFPRVEERCLEKKTFFIPVIIKKDKEKYGINESHPRYNDSLNSLRKIISLDKDNFGMAIFPEGTTQGGRKDDKGNFFGIHEADEGNAVDYIVSRFISKGTNFCILTVGINGSCNVFSPDDYKARDVDSKIVVRTGKVLKLVDFKYKRKSPSNIALTEIANNLLNPEFKSQSSTRVDIA